MTPEQQKRVRDLFEAAFDRDESDMRGWLAREAADDPAVRDEVLSLFDHHSQAGRFLEDAIGDATTQLWVDDEALPPGSTVGSYTIVRELGRGGMGRVYLASDTRLGRRVALKAVAPHLLNDPRQTARLRREARAAAALTHPGICTVYALEEIDGALYIASEFVDGRTLRDEIASGRRSSAEEILRTARELAEALASAHAAGVIHRDLKPENIMRTASGRLKVLDFGLARIDEGVAEGGEPSLSRAGFLIGTPAYMAPEQINGEPVDARADVFAFGVVIYEYACGLHPFHAATPLAVMARVLNSDAAPLSSRAANIPGGIEQIILRCLQKARADRYGSAIELVGALGQGVLPPVADHAQAVWWRIHQIVIVVLYASAAALGWRIKDWIETPLTVALFLALGAASTTGGVLRGHLMFTERVNRARLGRERWRTRLALRLLDLMVAALLVADGAAILRRSALMAAIALSLGLGVALAALVLEPSTTDAAFGESGGT